MLALRKYSTPVNWNVALYIFRILAQDLVIARRQIWMVKRRSLHYTVSQPMLSVKGETVNVSGTMQTVVKLVSKQFLKQLKIMYDICWLNLKSYANNQVEFLVVNRSIINIYQHIMISPHSKLHILPNKQMIKKNLYATVYDE